LIFYLLFYLIDEEPSNNATMEWSSYNVDPKINPSITNPYDVTWRDAVNNSTLLDMAVIGFLCRSNISRNL